MDGPLWENALWAKMGTIRAGVFDHKTQIVNCVTVNCVTHSNTVDNEVPQLRKWFSSVCYLGA